MKNICKDCNINANIVKEWKDKYKELEDCVKSIQVDVPLNTTKSKLNLPDIDSEFREYDNIICKEKLKENKKSHIRKEYELDIVVNYLK